jgi:hypothetical protein
MASSSGSASDTPRPRRTVRRGSEILVIKHVLVSLTSQATGQRAVPGQGREADVRSTTGGADLRISNGTLFTIARITDEKR